MSLVIRAAEDADHEALVDLKWQINKAEFAATPEESPARLMLDLSREAAVAGVEEYKSYLNESGGDWFVAELDGHVVGSTLWVPLAARAAFKPEYRRWGLVMGVAVAQAARGRGIGQALMQAAEQAMKAAGCSHGFLEVTADNMAATRLYQGCGYRALEVSMLKALV
jgi:GNAT superfamily N-acetyltransferase